MSDTSFPKKLIHHQRCEKCGEPVVEAALSGANHAVVIERQTAIPGTGSYGLISAGGYLFAVPGTDYREHVCKGNSSEFTDSEEELQQALSYALAVVRKPPAARSQRRMWRALQVLYRAHVRRFPI